jgi:hypothetical protein
MGRQNRVHWEHILRVNRVVGMEVFRRIFEVDCKLLFTENELFGMIMDKGKEVLWERFSMSMKRETEESKKINDTLAPANEAHKRNYKALFDIWFKDFKEKVLTDNSESEGLFEDLLMVYIFVRMMTNFAKKRDANYEERFMSLTIQNIISPAFVDIFLEIILQKDFLVSASDDWPDVQEKKTNEKDNTQAEQIDGNRNLKGEKYLFKAQLPDEPSLDIIDELRDKKKNGKIGEPELRGLLFEVAMYTMVLMVETCSGLYHYWLHQSIAQRVLPTFLSSTEYLMDLPEFGLKYRSVALQLYSCFAVFPNNGILTNRHEHLFLQTPLGGPETRCILNHATGDITDNFVKELGQTNKVEAFLDQNKTPLAKEIARKYYLLGLFPMIYKYIQGMYLVYSTHKDILTLASRLSTLSSSLTSTLSTLHSLFGQEGGERRGEEGIPSSLSNLVYPLPTYIDESEDRHRGLREIRGILSDIREKIKGLCHGMGKEGVEVVESIDRKYYRAAPITATRTNTEPWTTIQSSTLSTSDVHTPEYSYYQSLTSSYISTKQSILSQSAESNPLMIYLNSPSSSNKNIIKYIGIILERSCPALWTHGHNQYRFTPAPSSPPPVPSSDFDQKIYAQARLTSFNCTTTSLQARKNIDSLVVSYLTQPILHTILPFLSDGLLYCANIREVLLKEANEGGQGESTDPPNWTYNFLSYVLFAHSQLTSLTAYKTFQDREYTLLVKREKDMGMLIKSMCENNYMPSKLYLGEMVPRIAGLPQMNIPNHKAISFLAVKAESLCTLFRVHSNNYSMIVNEDFFEVSSTIDRIRMICAEACTGPCTSNQLAIYKLRSDVVMGVLRRMVNDIDSSLYQSKLVCIEYIHALLDGNNPETIAYYGACTVFDDMMDMITEHVKRLVIWTRYKQEAKAYAALGVEARKLRLEKEKKEAMHKNTIPLIAEELDTFGFNEFVNNIVKEEREASTSKLDNMKTTNQSIHHDKFNNYLDDMHKLYGSRFVSKEILDYYKIDNYQEILDYYMKSTDFWNHNLLQMSLSLNDFLIKFSSIMSTYNISLQNVYRSLIDHFGEDVPSHIHKELGNYERKEVTSPPSEKLIMYMFIVKISSQVEIYNLSTRRNQMVQFQLVPKTFFLTNKTKEAFIRSADAHSMPIEMMQNYHSFDSEMTDYLTVYQKLPWMYRLTSDDAFNQLKIILWLLGIAQNVLLIIFFRRNYTDVGIISIGNYVIIGIAVIIILLSALASVRWFFSRYSQMIKLSAAAVEEEEEKRRKSDKFRLFKIYFWRSIVLQSYLIIFLTHFLSNLFGIIFDPFFYTLQLLMIVFISKTTNYVLMAITIHFKQLSLTMFLAVLIMYSYSVLTAGHYWKYLEGNQPGQTGPIVCEQLWECLLFIVNQGLRNGGGISDSSMSLDPYESEAKYVGKFFYDLIFFILVNVISMNIIFGIIIDTFAAMREENDERGKNGG